ncbi:unnamed protein product, partial [Adineta steineri]
NQFIDQLISIRQKQTQILEEVLQLEMRILYKFLPPNLDQQETIVALIAYIPLNNKRYKMIQDAKRQWLRISLSVYETKLQEYNHQFQSILLNNTSLQGTSLLNDISRYVTYRTNEMKQSISSRMSIFRNKLLQHRKQLSL